MELQPGSSKALCHLGIGQLAEHEATGDNTSLCEAELSFRASIAMEGKPITSDNVPTQLGEQTWWKKKRPTKMEETKAAPAAPASGVQTAPQKGGGTTKQPATTGARSGPQAGRGRDSVAQPAAGRKPAAVTGSSRQPTKPVGRGTTTSAQGRAAGQTARTVGKPGGKTVATLGELKTGAGPLKKPTAAAAPSKSTESVKTEEKEKAPSTSSQLAAKKAEINAKTHYPRLGLARILSKSASSDKAKLEESHSLYQEVISMTPELHDAYIELGEMLSKTDPVAAVDAYAHFPFSNPPSFNDAYLHGEIVRLLMASENHDDPRLLTSLVAMGKALGIGVLEKQVSVLENKFKTDLLKKVYSGVHGKPIDDPDLQAFFKFKCWR